MANNYWLIIVVFLHAIHCANAQKYNGNWDAQITRFEYEGQADSVIYYYRLKADYYKQVDSLEAWAYCYYECQFLFDTEKRALSILDSALHKKWRQPRTAAEAEAFSLIQASRGFYLFNLGNILGAIQAQEAGLFYYKKYQFRDFDALEYFFKPLIANYTRLGDNEKARVIFQMAIKGDPSHGKGASLAGLYNNIGLTYWNEGDNETAISFYRQGLNCTGAEPEKIALLQSSLATSLIESGKPKEADAWLNKAILTLTRLPLQKENREAVCDYLSGAYLTKARLLRQNDRIAEALNYLQRALTSGLKARASKSHRDIAKIWIEFGAIYLQTNKPDKAIDAFNRAINAVIPAFQAQSPGDLPRANQLYEENAIYEALEGKADALLLKYSGSSDRQWLNTALQCHQLAAQSEILLRRSLQYESSKLGVLSHSRQRTEKAIRTAWELYRLTGSDVYLYKAWAFAEQAKAAILLEAIQRHHFQNDQANGDPLFATERRLRLQLAFFERELLLQPASPSRTEWQLQYNGLLDQLAATERQITQLYPAREAYRRQTDAFTGSDIALTRTTMPGYAVVEFFLGKKNLHVFCQSPSGTTNWVQLASPDSLGAQVRYLLTMMQSRTAMQTPGPYLALAHQIYTQTLQPALAPFDDKFDKLLIIPDGWMAFLPFESLLYEPARNAAWSQVPFLIKKYPVQYAFSLAVMERQQQLIIGAKRNILHLAPRFRDKQRGLPPLLGGDEEVAFYEKQLLDDRADYETLSQQAPLYRIIHLSTHAGVDSAGLLPRVELYDRAAYLPDIYALHLQADLVVLSACQTALGQFKAGEGVMSLSRAFAFAGAKGLVASLWTINEAATAKILRHMYEHLATGAPKPLALHQAKLDYLNDPTVPAFQKSPYYWAALTYAGDNGTVKIKGRQGVKCALLALLLLSGIAGVIWYWKRR
ncbi:MAG: CHAT domain-containing protein [Saprospiraceae bacterium]|nr:CHAT domain-containing protein [Saprospiraceae bacterium]